VSRITTSASASALNDALAVSAICLQLVQSVIISRHADDVIGNSTKRTS
jgi:hypothetical protein